MKGNPYEKEGGDDNKKIRKMPRQRERERWRGRERERQRERDLMEREREPIKICNFTTHERWAGRHTRRASVCLPLCPRGAEAAVLKTF